MAIARLLCIGDLHLGRRPTRLPASLSQAQRDELGPAASLGRAVAAAVDLGVDAVLFAGDVVESRDDRFEAFRPLEKAVRRLLDEGIEVLGVAGNHDDLALPRLAARIAGFRLIGAGGSWECVEVPTRAGLPVRVHGWSFPGPRVTESPLRGKGRFERHAGAVEIGLLHADLDAGRSPYAPVARAELEAAGLDAFLLGHIHGPDDLAATRAPIGYLGSLAPLDPGEPGRRGAWLLEAHGPGDVRMAPVADAWLRYDTAEVSVDGLEAARIEEELEGRIHGALESLAECVGAESSGGDPPRVLLARVTFTGRTVGHRALRSFLRREGENLRELIVAAGETGVYVESLVDRARPALDLEDLARGDDPPGLLAKELLALSRGEDTELFHQARKAFEAERDRPAWQALEAADGDGGEDDLRARLSDLAYELIEELLGQRARAGEEGP